MKFLKNKLTVTIIVLSVAFLGLIIFTVSKDTKGLEGSAGDALNPLQKIGYTVSSGTKNFVDFFLNFSDVKEENKEITKENKELQSELTQKSDLEAENERLRALLDFKEQRDNYNYIATNIMGFSGGGIIDGYIVDKGQDDGIEKGMVVIAANGLVGKVSSVGSNWSIIQAIINENIKVGVMVESTRESGILEGYTDNSNNNLVKVTNLPIDSTIKPGDKIITSGVGELYPKEIQVGEVISVEEDRVSVMKTAIVKPTVDFNKLEELFIVAPKDTRVIKYD
ncbi:rod shape-determining protein MreC [Clostridium vincentii]|uniref:Cell shape-determining protein MreC n=1 Tax=Clostridium vincentii TaxID=52704 RepID=A0A2T0BF45_9CLOT|nr:rod shape-determining protein MreC [Clostridium vincentii]PRR82443.1 Cell shape-determining protein MreC precursor [Clostridium vincentii]